MQPALSGTLGAERGCSGRGARQSHSRRSWGLRRGCDPSSGRRLAFPAGSGQRREQRPPSAGTAGRGSGSSPAGAGAGRGRREPGQTAAWEGAGRCPTPSGRRPAGHPRAPPGARTLGGCRAFPNHGLRGGDGGPAQSVSGFLTWTGIRLPPAASPRTGVRLGAHSLVPRLPDFVNLDKSLTSLPLRFLPPRGVIGE